MRPKSFYAGVLAIYQRITHDYLIFIGIYVIFSSSLPHICFLLIGTLEVMKSSTTSRVAIEVCVHTEKGRIAHT